MLGLGGGLPSTPTFAFTVKTDNAGTSLSTQFEFPLVAFGALNYFVDWGDGSAIENVTDLVTGQTAHTFLGGAGTYNICVTGDLSGWKFDNNGDAEKMMNISNFSGFAVTNNDVFWGCVNMDITATDILTIAATNGQNMFRVCTSLDSAILANYDTTAATNMAGMFRQNGDMLNLDISGWQISQATNMTSFMLASTLSTVNYDKLLIAWDAQGAMSYSGTLDMGTSKYTAGGAAETARTSLIAKFGALVDGGPV